MNASAEFISIPTPTSSTVKNRSPRSARKEMPGFPATVINLTTTPTMTTTNGVSLSPSSSSSSSSSSSLETSNAEYRSLSSRPMREAVILGVSFFFVYTAFQAIQNLQSSLHARGGLGVTALACAYGSGFFSSFFTPAFIYQVGVKRAILAAWVGHCLFVICNFFPHWMTLIPGSLLMGVLSCPLWTSLEIYITSLARQEMGENRQKKRTTFHAEFSRLNGAFFSIFMGSQLGGNLMSSTVLFHASYDQSQERHNQCGVGYCSASGHPTELATPDDRVVNLLLLVFLAIELCGLAVTAVYLPDLQKPRWSGLHVWRKLTSHLECLRQPRLWLLVPFLVSRMMNLAIEVGTFTQAYISCTLGVHMVGYVMACRGLATMTSAASLGYLARYTGRLPLCLAALTCDALIFLVLARWEPRGGGEEEGLFFLVAAWMGLVEGVWAVQVNALIAAMFPSRADSAFAVKGMWSSLSMALTFLLSSFLCPLARLYVAIVVIVVALVSYIVLEVKHLQKFAG